MIGHYNFYFLLHEVVELENLKTLITSQNGTISKEVHLGKKTLAFPIAKLLSADLYEWHVSLPTKNLNDFKKKLSFEDKLVRYLLLKKD